MRDSSALKKEFESLKRLTDAHRRGYDFQPFVGRLFQARNFRVEKKARAARPRQVDLFATRGGEMYLIETKWRKDRANSGDIDSLFTRLAAVPASVTGILVSYAGFTDEVVAKVKQESNRPVLLVSGFEIERALGWSGDFLKLLRDKKQALLVNREVLLDEAPKRRINAKKIKWSDLPSLTTEFLYPDGHRSSWLVSDGGFGMFAFIPEMPDIDWVSAGGSGVSVDVAVSVDGQNGLLEIIHQMAEMGWTSANGSWSIQQATANWHGFGTKSMGEALQGWATRYEGLETHHSEELCYVDEIDDGFYTLTASISADKDRSVWHAELSFQLVGIPLDLNPLWELCERLGVHERIHFRPRNEPSVNRGHPDRGAKLRSVVPVAYVVASPDSEMFGDSEWVVGIVVENPFKLGCGSKRKTMPTWVPSILSDTQYLICSLRSWHAADSHKSGYDLWTIESAWTSDALVVRAIADWRSDDEGEEMILQLYGDVTLEKDDNGEVDVTPVEADDAEAAIRPRKRSPLK
jgi:hypothetical protein